MRKLSLLLVICVMFAFANGCAVKDLYDSVQKASEAFTALDNLKKAQQQQLEKNKIFSIKATDNRTAFSIITPPDYTFNEVTIDLGRAIADGLYAKVSELTPRFSRPSQMKFSEENLKAISDGYSLLFAFKKAAQLDSYAVAIRPWSLEHETWKEEKAKDNTYSHNVNLHISCKGDTPEVCSKKLADAAIPGVMPYVSKFLKEFEYLP
jgi:hypothetical protein